MYLVGLGLCKPTTKPVDLPTGQTTKPVDLPTGQTTKPVDLPTGQTTKPVDLSMGQGTSRAVPTDLLKGCSLHIDPMNGCAGDPRRGDPVNVLKLLHPLDPLNNDQFGPLHGFFARLNNYRGKFCQFGLLHGLFAP